MAHNPIAAAVIRRDRNIVLAELDINPLMVLAEGGGVVAADALVRLYEAPQG